MSESAVSESAAASSSKSATAPESKSSSVQPKKSKSKKKKFDDTECEQIVSEYQDIFRSMQNLLEQAGITDPSSGGGGGGGRGSKKSKKKGKKRKKSKHGEKSKKSKKKKKKRKKSDRASGGGGGGGDGNDSEDSSDDESGESFARHHNSDIRGGRHESMCIAQLTAKRHYYCPACTSVQQVYFKVQKDWRGMCPSFKCYPVT